MLKHFDFNARVQGYTEAEHRHKNQFHLTAMRRLRLVAKAMGLEPGQYDVRSNRGGMAVSGEVTLHTEHVYVQVSQPGCMDKGIMFRTCEGRKDYSGGCNRWADANSLNYPETMAKWLRPLQLWGEACAADGIAKDSKFVCFSANNKAAQALNGELLAGVEYQLGTLEPITR